SEKPRFALALNCCQRAMADAIGPGCRATRLARALSHSCACWAVAGTEDVRADASRAAIHDVRTMLDMVANRSLSGAEHDERIGGRYAPARIWKRVYRIWRERCKCSLVRFRRLSRRSATARLT